MATQAQIHHFNMWAGYAAEHTASAMAALAKAAKTKSAKQRARFLASAAMHQRAAAVYAAQARNWVSR